MGEAARGGRRRSAALLATLLGALCAGAPGLVAGCGARTALRVEDAGPDGEILDEPDAGDAGVDAAPLCSTNADCEAMLDVVDLCNPVRCVEERCQPQPPVVCDDKDPCTGDRCEPSTGACVFEPLSFDLDKDGFKGPRPGTKVGDPTACGDDCDDTSPLAFPGGNEVCDGVDNDCNGIIDDEAKFIPLDADPTLVSDPALEKAYAAGLAYGGSELGYLAAYTGEKSQNSDIYMRPLAPTGEPLNPIIKVNGTTGDAIGGPMVWTGDRYGMTWSDRRDGNYEAYFNTFAPDGKKLGPDVRLSFADGFSVNATLAWNGSSFFVVWQDDRSDSFSVFGQKLTLAAAPVGDEQELALAEGLTQQAESPNIAASSLGLGLVYRVGDSAVSSIVFRPYDEQLKPTGPEVELAGGANYIDPYIVANGDGFIVVWGQKQPFRAYGAVIDTKGKILVKQTELSPGGGSFRRPLALALGDRVLVTYSLQADDGYELFSRTFSTTLTPLSPPQQLTKRIGDDLSQALIFGPDGDVGVYFDGKIVTSTGLRNGAFITRLRCDANMTGKP